MLMIRDLRRVLLALGRQSIFFVLAARLPSPLDAA